MSPQVRALPGIEEPFNSLSHLIGALVFASLAVPLLRRGRGDWRRVVLLAVFAFTGVFLLSMSGVFHMLEPDTTAWNVLRRLDKAAIFALIVGTHTPVQGLFFRGFARWGVLTIMWALAATGIVLFSVFHDSLPRGLGTGVYIALGWIAGISGITVWRRQGTASVLPLVIGGVVYTAGAVLLGLRWPTPWPGVIGPHELWHVAVLVAMGLHWRFVFLNARRPIDGT
jgi:channel protein (hemolysin III family)